MATALQMVFTTPFNFPPDTGGKGYQDRAIAVQTDKNPDLLTRRINPQVACGLWTAE